MISPSEFARAFYTTKNVIDTAQDRLEKLKARLDAANAYQDKSDDDTTKKDAMMAVQIAEIHNAIDFYCELIELYKNGGENQCGAAVKNRPKS